MPRTARKKSKTNMYHVLMRGNEKKQIFIDDKDREKFIDILKSKKENNEYKIYAYCLMDNHVHLLTHEIEQTISKSMKRINSSYAMYFNKKYDRVGHVFQDRFRSEAIEDEGYLISVTRYIHNNPIKAKLVKSLNEYKWSSYNYYINLDKTQTLVDILYILEIFNVDLDKAIHEFIDYNNLRSTGGFIDIKEKDNKIQNEEDALKYIIKTLSLSQIDYDDFLKLKPYKSDLKQQIILDLKEISNLSCREIANLTGVGKSTVSKIKNK